MKVIYVREPTEEEIEKTSKWSATTEKVLQAVKSKGSISPTELQQATSYQPNTIYAQISILRRMGLVEDARSSCIMNVDKQVVCTEFTREPEVEWTEKFVNRVVLGDSTVTLKEIPPNTIDLIITSPPYFQQREYGNLENEIGNENTVEEYIKNVMKVFSRCVEIIKPTGSIVFNIGDAYDDGNLLLIPWRFATEAQKIQGVKLINAVTWVKKNPTPRQYRKRLVSSTEPFFHFVKSYEYHHNIDQFLEENKREVRKTKQEGNTGQGYYDLIERSNLTQEQKEKARNDLAETIEQVRQGKITSFRMKIRGIHAPAFGGQSGGRQIQLEKQGYTIIKIHGNMIKRDVIEAAVETIKGRIHPAIYPEFIIKQFIKLTTRPNYIVLDPFMGSGTTCVAAKKLGRRYIGIDINPEYCKFVEERLKAIPIKIDTFL